MKSLELMWNLKQQCRENDQLWLQIYSEIHSGLRQSVLYLQMLESILQQYLWKLKKATIGFSIDYQIALSEAENLPCSGKDLCYVTWDENVDEKIKLILLNSVLMTQSPIWGRHGELKTKTKKDSTSMRDVSVIELKKIFFDDFFSSQIWWELWKTLDVICSHFTASCNKQFFDVRVHL